MERRKLGESDMEVTVLSLGAWAFGKYEPDWGKINDEESIRTIREAIDAGVNLIDTAKAYGEGYSEQIVGKAIKGRRDKVFLASKCRSGITKPEDICEDIDLCLKRMGVDCVDLYQVHYPSRTVPVSRIIEEMVKIQEAGKIRYIGVSNFSVNQMEEALEAGKFISCQPPYNIFWREIEVKGILSFCRENNIGVIVYSPLAQGLLTGKFTTRAQIPNDIRSRNKLFREGIFGKALEVIEYMRETAEHHDKTLAEVALNWVIQQAGITSAIMGAKRPSQLKDNLGACGWSLTPEESEEIGKRGMEVSKLLDYTTSIWG